MALRKASLDASFWINAYQGGLTPFLPDYFRLFVCSVVEREILPASISNTGQTMMRVPRKVGWL